MVKRLVLKTSNPRTLLENMHELGASFYCKAGDAYKVLYFAANREIHFQGPLTETELENIKNNSVLVKTITLDEFNDEIVIEE